MVLDSLIVVVPPIKKRNHPLSRIFQGSFQGSFQETFQGAFRGSFCVLVFEFSSVKRDWTAE